MGVSREHFVENWAVILAFIVLVVLQRNDVLECERLSCHRMLMELPDVGVDITKIIYCPVGCAGL